MLIEIPLLPNVASSLTNLDVSSNKITFVNPIALQILPNLNAIILSNNLLAVFPNFSHPQLYLISIDNNQLTTLPVLPSLSKQIASLSITSNLFQSLDVCTLASYPLLRSITINNNNLTTFPSLCVTFTFYNIRANGNPRNCDCRLRWMLTATSVTNNILYPKT